MGSVGIDSLFLSKPNWLIDRFAVFGNEIKFSVPEICACQNPQNKDLDLNIRQIKLQILTINNVNIRFCILTNIIAFNDLYNSLCLQH